jgi:hypothetical protein
MDVHIPSVTKEFVVGDNFKEMPLGIFSYISQASKKFLAENPMVLPRKSYTVSVHQPRIFCTTRDILEELGQGEMDLAAIRFILNKQEGGRRGPLLTNNRPNVFRVLTATVYFVWDEGRGWIMDVSYPSPETYLWNEEDRIFSRKAKVEQKK